MSLPLRLSAVFALFAVAALPAEAAPEKYVIDPMHTYPSLEMPHMGLSVWRGKFDRTSGEIQLDLAAKRGTVHVEVDADSIDFGLDAMHEHAVTADWLNVAKFPKLVYRGELQFTGDKPTSVKGELSLRGVTKPLTLQIKSFTASTSGEINAAFASFVRERPDAVVVGADAFFTARRIQLALLAALHRLPVVYPIRPFAEAGGLISYGTSLADAYRQAGVYTGRILSGAKPADLPVVRATKFELVINAETARLLGLTVPPSLLAVADEVIE